jgi:hypothetical protein
MDDAAAPLLLFVVGPPAVGKMTVGSAIAERTGLRLFHNHISIEVALRYFEYGTPAFSRISGGTRRLVVEEVAEPQRVPVVAGRLARIIVRRLYAFSGTFVAQ